VSPAPSASSASRVCTAGPNRSSTLSATPASTQKRRAVAVYSSEMSQQIRRPSGGSARATASDEYPVNVPISRQRRPPVSSVSSARTAPCSGAICMLIWGCEAVASRSLASTAGSRNPTRSM